MSHMLFSTFIRFLLGMLILSAPVTANTNEDINQAKAFLKDRLKELAQRYPFTDWEKQLSTCQSDLARVREQISDSNPGFDSKSYALSPKLTAEIQTHLKHRAEVNILMKELNATSLVAYTERKFLESGKTWDPDAKQAFKSALTKYEPGSLKPKSIFLANASALERSFRSLQADLQIAFAKAYLAHRVEDQLRIYNMAKIEALYSEYAFQLDYWSRALPEKDPQSFIQTQEQLNSLSKKFEENKAWIKKDLDGLIEVLNTDMLFSDLLDYAAKQKIELTLEVEEKIESSLKDQNQTTLDPIRDRIQLWKIFATKLQAQKSQADISASKVKALAKERLENQVKEDQRIQELQLEQQKAEEERKAKFKETLTALRTFTFKTETSVTLDGEAEKALATQAGFLKTSYVSSGSKKLKVDKDKFSDSLAVVEKFKVEAGQLDFSKMSLQERSNQSAYTYVSPQGRTSQGDLVNFVSEVAMGSFSSFYSFLSYIAPAQWKVGRPLSWKTDKGPEKAALDREFSYVDLVVDAHRKRSPKSSRHEENTINLPANMLLILDAHGAVKRFQSFGDIGQVIIKPDDLVEGKLYYKFLNYSTDRKNIYLNGIDGELKISVPGKS